MPAPYAEERAKLCQHAKLDSGCPACHLVQDVQDLEEAESGRLDAIAACESARYQLAHATNEQECEDAQESLDEATAAIPKWDDLIEGIEGELAASRVAVKAICDANEPETLVKAFAERAEAEMLERREIWRRATGMDDFSPFVDADPNLEA